MRCGVYVRVSTSFKYSVTPKEKIYYHLTCKNPNCKSKGIHYSSDKIEQKLVRILNELTRYMYDMDNEIIVCNSTKTKDIKDIEKAIEKLKMQEKKLVDLYLSSTLNIETINYKNDIIKKKIENLNKKKQQIDPNNDFKEYTIELLKKIDCTIKKDEVIFRNKIGFSFIFDSLNRKSKKELIKRLIDTIEIKRDKNYNIEITNVKFTEDVRDFTSYNFKPQLKTVGPKYGKMLGGIKAALDSVDGNAAMDELNAEGSLKLDVNGQEITLFREDLLIETAQIEGYVSENDNGITVVLDTNLTPELLEEGFVREIISKVQTMRKEADFEVMDRIRVTYDGSDKAEAIFAKYAGEIAGEVLANEVVKAQPSGYVKEWKINGEAVTMGVEKEGK